MSAHATSLRRVPHALLVALLAAAPAGCDPDPETEVVHGTAVDHGAALFNDPAIAGTSYNELACATCHTTGAPEEAIRAGADLAGAVDRPSYWGGQEVTLLRSINDCLYYFMLRDAPLAGDDEEAELLYAYLASLPAGATGADPVPFTAVRDVADLAAGDAGRGGVVYNRACLRCHGMARTGEARLVSRAPILPQQTLEEHPAPDYDDTDRRLVFVEKVRHGGFYGYGGQMPPFSLEKLSDEELADLLSYLGLY
jgi:thiosulfate dehydrogenase